MANTTAPNSTRTTPPKQPNRVASRVQRIHGDHDQMVETFAQQTGRKRQEIVNDALDAGLGLVLLHQHDPRAARAILDEVQRRLQVFMFAAAAQAAAAAPKT